MPKNPNDNHPDTTKPDMCKNVLELLGLKWERGDSSNETKSEGGGTCTKQAWSKVYDKLLDLQKKGIKFTD